MFAWLVAGLMNQTRPEAVMCMCVYLSRIVRFGQTRGRGERGERGERGAISVVTSDFVGRSPTRLPSAGPWGDLEICSASCAHVVAFPGPGNKPDQTRGSLNGLE